VFSRKPIFGYRGFILATILIDAYSFSVWAHHMFVTGVVNNPSFAAMSILIAVPTWIKFFNWIATMWRGRIRSETPMLFCLDFLFMFLLGGITGIFVASPPIDFAGKRHLLRGRAHALRAVRGLGLRRLRGALLLGAQDERARLGEGLGKLHFWLMLIGFNHTFFPCTSWASMGCSAASPTTLAPAKVSAAGAALRGRADRHAVPHPALVGLVDREPRPVIFEEVGVGIVAHHVSHAPGEDHVRGLGSLTWSWPIYKTGAGAGPARLRGDGDPRCRERHRGKRSGGAHTRLGG
jgi:hypothetical protein